MAQPLLGSLDVRRAFVLGDAHGNDAFMSYAIASAARNGCQVVLQLGDFGYWEHTRSGRVYLDTVERVARECGVPVLFIDGNHENHDMLRAHSAFGDVGSDGVCWVRPHVGWLTRGVMWEWCGVRFGAVGGAASVDRVMRTPGWTWWAEEVLVAADVARLLGHQVDVLLSHDAPSVANMVGRTTIPADDLRRCEMSRKVLDEVVNSCQPEIVMHGHWHRQHRTRSGDVYVVGLGDDGGAFNLAAVILDLPTLELVEVLRDGTAGAADHTWRNAIDSHGM